MFSTEESDWQFTKINFHVQSFPPGWVFGEEEGWSTCLAEFACSSPTRMCFSAFSLFSRLARSKVTAATCSLRSRQSCSRTVTQMWLYLLRFFANEMNLFWKASKDVLLIMFRHMVLQRSIIKGSWDGASDDAPFTNCMLTSANAQFISTGPQTPSPPEINLQNWSAPDSFFLCSIEVWCLARRDHASQSWKFERVHVWRKIPSVTICETLCQFKPLIYIKESAIKISNTKTNTH